MNYGFAIDNRACIGCHACSVACKSENEVPLGVSRTWVKYVETGEFPNSRRHFQVTRCNHCANPPCVRICPTQAMYQRDDGIVEFDPTACIGCKACMQACPYDAIYIDPDEGTAAKCHFCAHRTDVGLEPACVVVCPTHAIIAGDMDDPRSEISRALAENQVTVRKPEQGTAPKVFYINGNDVALHPTATERAPETFMWADVIPLHPRSSAGNHNGHAGHNGQNGHHGGNGQQASALAGPAQQIAFPANAETKVPANVGITATAQAGKFSSSGVPLRTPQPQGVNWAGPIQFGGRMAEHMVQVAYNAQHKIPWHWPVPAYLVTKGIGAGIFILLSLGLGLGLFPFHPLTAVAAGLLSLLFIGATTALLVYDLDRPERFFKILLRPQWKSWLARGAFILVGFTMLAGLWWLLETAAYLNLLPEDVAAVVRPVALWLGLPLAAGVAVYTAFLFGQAEGRDLWQSSLLPLHLLIQAVLAGSALFLLLDLVLAMPADLSRFVIVTFAASVLLDLGVTLFGEFGMPHASEVAARAAHDISHGTYRNHFWLGSIALGHGVPLLLMLLGAPLAAAVAAVCAIVGLYLYEYAFVMAPQEIPNS